MTDPREGQGPAHRSLGGEAELEAAHRRERELNEQIRAMHEDDLVDFIRETVVRLDALADRLEVYTPERKGGTK